MPLQKREGFFFSSKMVDRFALWSDNHITCWKAASELSVVQSHLLAYAARIGKVGTCVMMILEIRLPQSHWL